MAGQTGWEHQARLRDAARRKARAQLEFADGNVIAATGKPERGFVSVVGAASGAVGVEIAVDGAGALAPETKNELEAALAAAAGAPKEPEQPTPSGASEAFRCSKHRRSAALLATVAALAMLADLPGKGSR